MGIRDILKKDSSDESLQDDQTECLCYETDNGETVIVDCPRLSNPPMTPNAETVTKDQEETKAIEEEEKEKRVAEKKAAELAALEATKHYYYHTRDQRVFVRNTADVVEDILYTVRMLGVMKEEKYAITPEDSDITTPEDVDIITPEDVDAVTPRVSEITPEQHLELCHRENPLFKTKFPTYRPLPTRIYLKPDKAPQHEARPLPSHWGPDRREKWEKFCERKREEGRQIIALRDKNQRERLDGAWRKAKRADYFWEWMTETKGERNWMFVWDEHDQEPDEAFVPVIPDELKGPKLRAEDRAMGKRNRTHSRQESGSDGFESSAGRRIGGRSSETHNKWVHWRDKSLD